MNFGNKLKELRKEKGLTQADLAQKLKLSKANISKYEANLVEPNLDTLAMVSHIFDVSINYLLDIPEKNICLEALTAREQDWMISEILKELRLQKKVTQDEMAQLLNIKRQTYSAYERGISLPDIHALMKMAEFFGVSTDYLLGYKPSDSNTQTVSPELNSLLISCSTLSKEDLKKVIEYIEFLKSKKE